MSQIITDNYEINESRLLGEGNFAKVYLGKQKQTGQEVAIKIIDIDKVEDKNKKFIKDEIKIANLKLIHQNIIQYYDAYIQGKMIYIVMECCETGTLQNLIDQKKYLDVQQSTDIIQQICQAMIFLYKKGIVHRDLKPQNIMIKNGQVKICDFGFGKQVSNIDEHLFDSPIGTPLYMAPQLLTQSKYTCLSEIWAIGIIFYQMIFGITPWNVIKSVKDLIQQIYTKPIRIFFQIPNNVLDFINKTIQINESTRMSWQELQNHSLVYQQTDKSGQIQKNVQLDSCSTTETLQYKQFTQDELNYHQLLIQKRIIILLLDCTQFTCIVLFIKDEYPELEGNLRKFKKITFEYVYNLCENIQSSNIGILSKSEQNIQLQETKLNILNIKQTVEKQIQKYQQFKICYQKPKIQDEYLNQLFQITRILNHFQFNKNKNIVNHLNKLVQIQKILQIFNKKDYDRYIIVHQRSKIKSYILEYNKIEIDYPKLRKEIYDLQK